MAGAAAHPKQTEPYSALHDMPALIALGRTVRLLPQHTQPFRRRHIVFAVVAVAFMAAMLLELGAVISRQSLDPRTLFTQSVTAPLVTTTSQVRSSDGFGLSFNNEQFTARVIGDELNGSISDADLKRGAALHRVILTPLPSHVPLTEAATELEIGSEADSSAYAIFKAKRTVTTTDPALLRADYFAPSATASSKVSLDERTTDTLAGVAMTKSVYTVTPTFAGNPTKSIIWTGEVQGRPFVVAIRGIMVGSDVPSSMTLVLQSLSIESASKVEGLSSVFGSTQTNQVDQNYVADMVSPAVIKLYHIVCGTLIYKSNVLTTDTCSGTTGSGFIIASDGYIATNGHVVVYGAKDMLANLLVSNKLLLASYLKGAALSEKQITEVMDRPELTASAISKIYDLSDSDLRFDNQREITVAALGDTPLDISSDSAIKRTMSSFSDTDKLKRATVVGYDYAAKDQFTVLSDIGQGFTARDVALLKVDGLNMPFVPLSQQTTLQNQKISVFGFPGDADNQLIDKSSLGVTVTNGSISAIRKAAGGEGTLFQSDADASHGSSGGPAVNDQGQAIGILTYRFASGKSTDSAKSYIRDIDDLRQLAAQKGVQLDTTSKVQTAWQKGLDLYSKDHYSQALEQFRIVANAYPVHRLVGEYMQLSQQAINSGKDSRDPSILLLLLGTGMGAGALALAVVLIARHHGKHKVYRTFHAHNIAIRSH